MKNPMTKAEMVERLEAAVGETAYGKELIAALEAAYDDADKKYGQDALDRLDDRLGFLAYYMEKDANMGEDAKAAAEAEKLAIVKKAAAALR